LPVCCNLRIEPRPTGTGGSVGIRADVRNTGDRAAQEVVQLYVRDVLNSVAAPAQQLRGFERIALDPRQSKAIGFALTPEHLALLNRHLE